MIKFMIKIREMIFPPKFGGNAHRICAWAVRWYLTKSSNGLAFTTSAFSENSVGNFGGFSKVFKIIR